MVVGYHCTTILGNPHTQTFRTETFGWSLNDLEFPTQMVGADGHHKVRVLFSTKQSIPSIPTATFGFVFFWGVSLSYKIHGTNGIFTYICHKISQMWVDNNIISRTLGIFDSVTVESI